MLSSTVSVRAAEIDDAPIILDIFLESDSQSDFKRGIDLVSVMDWIEAAQPHRPLWVLESSAGVMGWCTLESFYGLPAFEGAVEISLYIAQCYQHQGLGSYMLGYLAQRHIELNIHSVVAHVLESNHSSHSFFSKHGFQLWGRLPNIARSTHVQDSLLLLGIQYS